MSNKKGSAAIAFVLVIAIVIFGVSGYVIINNDETPKESVNEQQEKVEESIEENVLDKTEVETESTNKFITAYEEKLLGQDRYALKDIDGDTVPELITYKEDMSSDKVIANYTFYSFVNGEVVQLGQISGKIDNNILYKMEDNTLLAVYGYMGYEIKTTYNIESSNLVEIERETRNVPTGESYATGDSIIPFDFTTDTIQFEIYK